MKITCISQRNLQTNISLPKVYDFAGFLCICILNLVRVFSSFHPTWVKCLYIFLLTDVYPKHHWLNHMFTY